MANKQVVEYFNRLHSGSFATDKVAQVGTGLDEKTAEELQQILQSSEYEAKGQYKTCSFFGDRKIFACLKSKNQYLPAEIQRFRDEAYNMIQLNNKLVSKGACVPKLYSIFFADKHYVEIQHRVYGKPLAIFKINFFSEEILGHAINPNSPQSEKDIVGKQLFEYNLEQQKKLIKLPVEEYSKMLKTMLAFNDLGIYFYDNHCENILIGEKGLTIVDFDYMEALFQRRRMFENQGRTDVGKQFKRRSEVDIAECFIKPFSFARQHMFCLSPQQQQQLMKNDVEILKKLVDAISLNKIVVPADNPRFVEYANVVFEGQFDQIAPYILSSQQQLRQQMGLAPLAMPTAKGKK